MLAEDFKSKRLLDLLDRVEHRVKHAERCRGTPDQREFEVEAAYAITLLADFMKATETKLDFALEFRRA